MHAPETQTDFYFVILSSGSGNHELHVSLPRAGRCRFGCHIRFCLVFFSKFWLPCFSDGHGVHGYVLWQDLVKHMLGSTQNQLIDSYLPNYGTGFFNLGDAFIDTFQVGRYKTDGSIPFYDWVNRIDWSAWEVHDIFPGSRCIFGVDDQSWQAGCMSRDLLDDCIFGNRDDPWSTSAFTTKTRESWSESMYPVWDMRPCMPHEHPCDIRWHHGDREHDWSASCVRCVWITALYMHWRISSGGSEWTEWFMKICEVSWWGGFLIIADRGKWQGFQS